MEYIILLILFIPAIEKQTEFTYLDELLVCLFLFAIIWCLIKRKKFIINIEKKIAIYLSCFYLIGTLSTIFYNYQNSVLYGMLSGIFSLKSFIAYFGIRALCKLFPISMFSKDKKIYLIVGFFIFVSGCLLLIDTLYPFFPQSLEDRFGLHPTSYIFTQATEVGCISIASLVLFLFLKKCHNYQGNIPLILFMAAVMTLRSGRYKAMGFIVLFYTLYLIIPFVKNFKLKYVLVTIPAVLFFAWTQLLFYFTDATSARGLLYIQGFQIMLDHFPLGSGFGTFGTEFSRLHYSPLYFKYGMSNYWGFLEGQADFVADTMWPPIMGESGFVGFICIFIAFILFLKLISRINTDKASKMFLYSIIIYGLFESIADSIFMSNRGVIIFSIFAFMISIMEKKRNMKIQNDISIKKHQ